MHQFNQSIDVMLSEVCLFTSGLPFGGALAPANFRSSPTKIGW